MTETLLSVVDSKCGAPQPFLLIFASDALCHLISYTYSFYPLHMWGWGWLQFLVGINTVTSSAKIRNQQLHITPPSCSLWQVSPTQKYLCILYTPPSPFPLYIWIYVYICIPIPYIHIYTLYPRSVLYISWAPWGLAAVSDNSLVECNKDIPMLPLAPLLSYIMKC